MNTEHNCKEELQAFDLRATPARLAVLKLLENSEKPLDVEEVQNFLQKKHIPADPATIFRMMNTFIEKGITTPVQFLEGKMRYELASKNDHHHLICESCGLVQDVDDTVVPSLIEKIEKQQRFLVKSHSLEFFGLCKNCQK